MRWVPSGVHGHLLARRRARIDDCRETLKSGLAACPLRSRTSLLLSLLLLLSNAALRGQSSDTSTRSRGAPKMRTKLVLTPLPLLLLLILGLGGGMCRADTLAQYLKKELSECSLSCVTDVVAASSCRNLANATCVCASPDLQHDAVRCAATSCSKPEAMTVGRVTDDACGLKRRSRRIDFWGITAVEGLTFLCLCFRIYGRYLVTRSFEAEDYMMMAVFVLFIVFTVIGKYTSLTAFGVDIWTVPPDTIAYCLKLFYVEEAFYLLLLSLTKAAILCLYLRIFPNRWFRLASWATLAFVSLSTLIMIFLSIFQCSPIGYNWEAWRGEGAAATTRHRCLDVNALSYAAAGFAIAQEIAILTLPLPLLVRLNTTWRKRASIILMFSLGVFVLITSCARLRYLLSFARSANPTWDYTDLMVWTALEVNVSIVVASLPAIRQLLARARGGSARQDQQQQQLGLQGRRASTTTPDLAASVARLKWSRSQPSPGLSERSAESPAGPPAYVRRFLNHHYHDHHHHQQQQKSSNPRLSWSAFHTWTLGAVGGGDAAARGHMLGAPPQPRAVTLTQIVAEPPPPRPLRPAARSGRTASHPGSAPFSERPGIRVLTTISSDAVANIRGAPGR
ncbi:hypothetical protein GGR56DRAFT_27595 [Xylariaceae sp. FL0804]|nr:hypothetical protein GGR56DRAFT_27595 [Xylariaceae sp. FL0804]